MSNHRAKQRIYEQFARVGKALAAPGRLELIDLLMQGERSVDALANEAQMSAANTSQHLQVLLAARLVGTRRDATRIYYRIAAPSVAELWLALRRTAETQLAELPAVAREYLGDPDGFEPIERDELARRIAAATAVDLEIYPAHFAGSACGAGMSGKPTSTIAFEKRWNPLLGLDEAAFLEQVGGTLPPRPEAMAEILRFNQGRA